MDPTELRDQLEALHEAGYGWALSCCRGDEELAEETLQQSYVKLLSGQARFGGKSTFKTWLFGVIRRTAAEELRKSARRRMRLAALDPPDSPPTPESSVDGDALRNLLGTLSERQRDVLHLVFYQELTIEQAAEAMGISIGSARTHYARGKQRLRDQWANPEAGRER